MLELPFDCREKIYSHLAPQDLASCAQSCKQARADLESLDQRVWRVAGNKAYGSQAFNKVCQALTPPSPRMATQLLAQGIPQRIEQHLSQAKHKLTSPGLEALRASLAATEAADTLATRHGLNIEGDQAAVYDHALSYQDRRVQEIMQHLGCDKEQATTLEQDEYLFGIAAF